MKLEAPVDTRTRGKADMNKNKIFWKNYWNSFSEESISDHELDRGFVTREEEITKIKTISIVDVQAHDLVLDAVPV